ncbi:STE3-like pheromone receptor [Vararia minispora EC-137]|uniref:STE3-like pheromone receptor n=1 Tax=Vararia minispora EC-137 TaxID=1314806 RepID=A0ACB8QMI3_9AGAM|nr:STE3-like pheromone receptor [Vararia minispora EC-137]
MPTPGDSTYPLFPILAFLAFVFTLAPFPWHFYAWNSGTCLFMFWVSMSCLIVFVDSVVWHGNVINNNPGYCDFATHFMVAASIGIPAASFCISRRIYAISCVHAVAVTPKDKFRAVLFDLAAAFVFPVLAIPLHFVVQGHRFDIEEDVGCVSVTLNIWPAYPLVYMWPALIGCVSFVYSCLSLWKFITHRAALTQMLSSGGALSQSQFIRLLLLSLAEMMCTIPLSIYNIAINASNGTVGGWTSWDDVHFDFDHVNQIPRVFWQSNRYLSVALQFTSWLPLLCAFVFIVLFALSSDARRHYVFAFNYVLKKTGLGSRLSRRQRYAIYFVPRD